MLNLYNLESCRVKTMQTSKNETELTFGIYIANYYEKNYTCTMMESAIVHENLVISIKMAVLGFFKKALRLILDQ